MDQAQIKCALCGKWVTGEEDLGRQSLANVSWKEEAETAIGRYPEGDVGHLYDEIL